MGESGQCAIQAGVGSVKPAFRDRGLPFLRGDEESTATHYKVKMNAGGGQSVTGEHTSTSRVGHIRYSFNAKDAPFVVLQSTRMTVITSDPTNITSVLGGAVHIDPAAREISGRNPERQDWILGPSEAASFAGYYVARFSQPFASYGTANGAVVHEGETDLEDGTEIAGWAMFAEGTAEVVARVGTSFISIDQARRNLDREIPNGQTLEQTAAACRAAWSEKLDRIRFDGQDAEREDSKWLRVFYSESWLPPLPVRSVETDAATPGPYPPPQPPSGTPCSTRPRPRRTAATTRATTTACTPARATRPTASGTRSGPRGRGRSSLRPSASEASSRRCCKTTSRKAGSRCGRTLWRPTSWSVPARSFAPAGCSS